MKQRFQRAFDDIIKISQYASQTVVASLKEKVCSKMMRHNAPSEFCQEVDSIFDNSKNYHEKFQSAYLQNKYISLVGPPHRQDTPYLSSLATLPATSAFCNCTPYNSYNKFKRFDVEFELVVSGDDGIIKGGRGLLSSFSMSGIESEAAPGCRRYLSESGLICDTAS